MKKKANKHGVAFGDKAGNPGPTRPRHIRLGNATEARLTWLNCSDKLEHWEQGFREAAKADKCEILRAHLEKLGLPDKPKLLLEGTIIVVRACVAYASTGGPSAGPKIPTMQKYNPSEAAGAKYAVTFDLWGHAYARVLALPGIVPLDLADLYGHPWSCLKCCGYSRFWISRTDGRDLTRQEVARVERAVTDDLRFDFREEELDIWFSEYDAVALQRIIEDSDDDEERKTLLDELCPRGALLVRVQDLTSPKTSECQWA